MSNRSCEDSCVYKVFSFSTKACVFVHVRTYACEGLVTIPGTEDPPAKAHPSLNSVVTLTFGLNQHSM